MPEMQHSQPEVIFSAIDEQIDRTMREMIDLADEADKARKCFDSDQERKSELVDEIREVSQSIERLSLVSRRYSKAGSESNRLELEEKLQNARDKFRAFQIELKRIRKSLEDRGARMEKIDDSFNKSEARLAELERKGRKLDELLDSIDPDEPKN